MPTAFHQDPGVLIREAGLDDIPVLARHRAAMFRDMGSIQPELDAPLITATASYLSAAMPRGDYLGWIARTPDAPTAIGGAGVQLRPLVPRPSGDGLEFGPEAIVLNVYVEPEWRCRGVGEALMRALLQALALRRIRRIVLHASEDGRRLYERLGFVQTNEMRLEPSPAAEFSD